VHYIIMSLIDNFGESTEERITKSIVIILTRYLGS